MPGRKLCQRSDGRAGVSLCRAGRDLDSRTGAVARMGRGFSFAEMTGSADCSGQLPLFGELNFTSRAATLALAQAISRQRQRRVGMAEVLREWLAGVAAGSDPVGCRIYRDPRASTPGPKIRRQAVAATHVSYARCGHRPLPARPHNGGHVDEACRDRARSTAAPGPAVSLDDRALLQRLTRGAVSGDALAREFDLTRAAIWKRIAALREAGVPIEARAGRGYRLAQPLDLLDAASIAAALPADARAQLDALDVAWSIDSTNSELLRRRTPGHAASVLLAERQTGGRGRLGRVWASPLAAHVYLSLARRFGGGLARLGGLSLVAGIATAEALHDLGIPSVRLKWPNDLVVEHADGLRKLGGLLVEGGGEHAGPVRAVIGLGLNVRMPADAAAGIGQPWCDLAQLALPMAAPSRNAVVAAVLARWLPALERFDADGLAPFLPRYAAFDALAGQPLVLHGANGIESATALGLADDGGLRVRLASGDERHVHSGEVSVRRTGP
jgi:BirA family biotin operon repressor/biotin-[acetyl-CoA-carboxylase] ligase